MCHFCGQLHKSPVHKSNLFGQPYHLRASWCTTFTMSSTSFILCFNEPISLLYSKCYFYFIFCHSRLLTIFLSFPGMLLLPVCFQYKFFQFDHIQDTFFYLLPTLHTMSYCNLFYTHYQVYMLIVSVAPDQLFHPKNV